MSNFLRRHLAPRGRRPNDHERKYFGTDWKALDADFKPFINTMILVATLIATITFAAAFTMPGGFDASGDKLGAATLAKTVALKIFIWADSIAMCCSITVVFLLSFAMLAEQDVLPSVAENSFMLLYLTFFATLVAFMSGIFAVIAPKALWLAISVCIFCAAAFGLIAPGRLPGYPLNTLLHPVICRRNLQGQWEKTKQRNERKSEQNNIRSLIESTPDTKL
ncbi:hypothetical protein Vadar_008438 [Vaccinium darrowii]|uniref:Uncharacterized protein n=1 Tax=Vaccinium darrowii TaxID=229202 RepID=A0ACB7XP87_9ERIC|nr:hypothetical protein Vadar_008438 [Vaccinium darrowii]